jgi:mannose-6-phosphate isomerase-like protein (cupin superfamily)
MSAHLCLLAFRNHWFEATELELIRNGFDAAKHAYENASTSGLLGKPSFVSLLYVTAQLNPTSFDRLHAMLEDEISSIPEFSPEEYAVWDSVWMEIQWRRTGMLNEKINARKALTHSDKEEDFRSSLTDARLDGIYENHSDKLSIDFKVQRLPFPLEVLDPRIVRIPPGKTNELHKHAHETVFIFMQGSGHVKVDQVRIPVVPGDFVFIPRWCLHQSINESDGEMIFLAVADFGLTGKSFTGNYLKTARLKTE